MSLYDFFKDSARIVIYQSLVIFGAVELLDRQKLSRLIRLCPWGDPCYTRFGKIISSKGAV